MIRNHSGVGIDLEPLLAVTPVLSCDDPRLLEQVLCWCVSHRDRVNTARLTMLVHRLPAEACRIFKSFASTVNAVAKTTWPAEGSPWDSLPRLRDVPLPLQRKSLFRLRARVLCGVGTRADVLCDLLARPRNWSTAAELAEHGHSKRNIARTLVDFESAQIGISLSRGNALQFRAAHPATIAAALGGLPTAHPDWTTIFSLVLLLLEIGDFENAPVPVQQVEAATRRNTLALLSEQLSLKSPPLTAGIPDAWHILMDWGVSQLADLANAKSTAFGQISNVSPEQNQLWDKFVHELEEHPISEWEFHGHLSGWPQHQNQLSKLMLRHTSGRRQWWRFEEDISQVPHDYEKAYQAPAWMRLTGTALLLDFLDAQCGTPSGDDKPAIERAIAEVRRMIKELRQATPHRAIQTA